MESIARGRTRGRAAKDFIEGMEVDDDITYVMSEKENRK